MLAESRSRRHLVQFPAQAILAMVFPVACAAPVRGITAADFDSSVHDGAGVVLPSVDRSILERQLHAVDEACHAVAYRPLITGLSRRPRR
jgi:hypothetical protein